MCFVLFFPTQFPYKYRQEYNVTEETIIQSPRTLETYGLISLACLREYLFPLSLIIIFGNEDKDLFKNFCDAYKAWEIPQPQGRERGRERERERERERDSIHQVEGSRDINFGACQYNAVFYD